MLVPAVDVEALIAGVHTEEARRTQRVHLLGWAPHTRVVAHHIGDHFGVNIVAEDTIERVIERPRPQRHQTPDHRVSVHARESRHSQRLAMRDETLLHLYEGHRRLPRSLYLPNKRQRS